MGHPALNQLQAKISTCYLAVEVQIVEEVQTIYGNKKTAQECYCASIKEVEKMEEKLDDDSKVPKIEPEGDYELFMLDSSKHD